MTDASLFASARSADWFSRATVARNAATPPALLERLAGDDEWQVRHGVALNPATPPDALARLAGDTKRYVRHAVARTVTVKPLDQLEDASEENVVGEICEALWFMGFSTLWRLALLTPSGR